MKTLSIVFLLMGFNTQAAYAEDSRQVIWLSVEQKNALMQEMRHFLQVSQTILENAMSENLEEIEQDARSMGVKAMKATPPSLSKQFPAAFKAIGPKVHLGFEDIANEASGLGDTTVILKRLAEVQSHCIQCHAQYQIKVR